ncbi:hypothetical protein B0A55_06630 [Friedmanniomyces simplex]|uniref:N-acetylgalactosaminide beta-1,3-galactosyltransferase n=1 Tax=Friedmanniomyces simplex TaxID=329884 RepID=A0A4U0XQ87_9PEZI|nr:hypothetical protein B0A55_06630 [Friedmanniomyces simplex]
MAMLISAHRLLLGAGCLLCLALLRHITPRPALTWSRPYENDQARPNADHDGTALPTPTPLSLTCELPEGLDDVLVVLKTGATEIYEKLPIHLATTFACLPDYLVYSDVAQQFGAVPVHDALALVSEELRQRHDDLAYYRTLQQHVLSGGDAAELQGDKSWSLDKWKFLPMISDAYRRFDARKRWFVFIEADTYLSAHNLRLWLKQLDASVPVYAGAQVMIGDTEFAHGGSGFVLSVTAAKAFAEVYRKKQTHWEYKMASECCGDKLMAEVLLEATPPVTLHRSFPIIQGETLTSLDWTPTHWCTPAVSWHHADPAGIDKLWRFERGWRHDTGAEWPILFAEYFAAFIEPRISAANGTMRGWDNLSNDWVYEEGNIVHPSYTSATACESFCRQHAQCLQWAWSPGVCRGGKAVRLGRALASRPALGSADGRVARVGVQGKDGAVSGWMLDRFAAWRSQQEPCSTAGLWNTHVW